MKQQSILGIIPARYGSSRFPGKMLAGILGKTLLQWTFENACRALPKDRIIIATDDNRIYNHAKDFGAAVVMTSPTCVNGTERLAEVCRNYNHSPDIVINIQGDEPLLDPEAVNKTIEALIKSPEASMATAVVPITCPEEALSPSVVKCVFDPKGYALYFSRSLIPSNQTGTYRPSDKYYRHLGLYAYRPDFLQTYISLPSTPLQQTEDLEQLKVLEQGYKIKIAIVKSSFVGVDTPEDIAKIEKYLCRQNSSL